MLALAPALRNLENLNLLNGININTNEVVQKQLVVEVIFAGAANFPVNNDITDVVRLQ